MGQKTNPIIFRLGKTTSWKSKYLEQKLQDSAVYSFQDSEIRKFIDKFFKNNGLSVHNCKLCYLENNTLHIFISYYLTLHSITLMDDINKNQNIRLKQIGEEKDTNHKQTKYQNYNKKKPKQSRIYYKKKRKRYRILLNNIKKLEYYQRFSYNELLKQNVRKESIEKAKTAFQISNNTLRIRRLYLLECYKNYWALKKYKQINEVYANSFLENFCEGLHLFLNKNTKIFLTLKQLNKDQKNKIPLTKKRKIKMLKKILVKLRRFKQNNFFKEGMSSLFLAITQPHSARLLAKFIAIQLQKQKRHNFFFRFLKRAGSILVKKKFSNIYGIKLKIKGRINGARRARYRILTIGKKVPVLTLNANIDYSEEIAFTLNGTLGVKIWIYSKNLC